MTPVASAEVFLVKADVALDDATLANLRATPDAALGIDDGLLEGIRGAFALPAGAFTPLQGGTFHRLYVAPGGDRLARIAALAAEPWTGLMAMECLLASELRARELAVPQCEFKALRSGAAQRGVQLVERLQGEPAKAGDDDEEVALGHLAAMAGFLRDLHRIGGAGFGPLRLSGIPGKRLLSGPMARWSEFLGARLEDHLGTCAEIGVIEASAVPRIIRFFEDAGALLDRAQPRLLHGDPGNHNFIMRDGSLAGVIDWEDALLGDPLFDLAGLCTFHPRRRHAHIVQSYGADLAPGSEAWRRFWLSFLRIAIAKTVHRHRFGYADVPGRPPASARIGMALEALSSAPPP